MHKIDQGLGGFPFKLLLITCQQKKQWIKTYKQYHQLTSGSIFRAINDWNSLSIHIQWNLTNPNSLV